MREFPEGGLIGKAVHLWHRVSDLRVPLYAANASFFLILAVFPGLLLLLGLLRYTPLEVERLGEMLTGFLPEAPQAAAPGRGRHRACAAAGARPEQRPRAAGRGCRPPAAGRDA